MHSMLPFIVTLISGLFVDWAMKLKEENEDQSSENNTVQNS